MARPQKLGLEYFPLDVDIFDDEKVIPISAEYGNKGELILIRVLCAIYRNGYFIERSDSLYFKIAKQAGVSHALVTDVISGLVRWGFFNKSLFDSVGILTSKGIQKRWKEAVRRRVIDTTDLAYWIADENENDEFLTSETPQSDNRNPAKVVNLTSEMQQSKVKESKVDNNPLPQMGESESLKTDLKKIVDHYNQVCKRMPRVTTLSDARKKAIKNRVKQYGESKVLEMFDLAAASEFLNGNNGHEWTANLDWLLKPSNFVKVIDGNYKNIRSNGKHKASDPRASVSGYQEKL